MIKDLIKIFKGESLLDKAYKQSYKMFDITKDMFIEGTTSLRQRDHGKLKSTIYDQDLAVNKFEQKVRKNVFKHLSSSGTVDIYSGLVLVSVIIDLERLGDYTKNIVDLAKNHPKKLKGGQYEEDLNKIENAISKSYGVDKEAFLYGNADLASNFLAEFDWVNKLCNTHILNYVEEKDKTVKGCDAVILALYYRYLKRINSHLRNIASSVVNPFDKIGFYNKNNTE